MERVRKEPLPVLVKAQTRLRQYAWLAVVLTVLTTALIALSAHHMTQWLFLVSWTLSVMKVAEQWGVLDTLREHQSAIRYYEERWGEQD
jgi:1,4-dihydroxy-2-naphthoate octaprenyltransferase